MKFISKKKKRVELDEGLQRVIDDVLERHPDLSSSEQAQHLLEVEIEQRGLPSQPLDWLQAVADELVNRRLSVVSIEALSSPTPRSRIVDAFVPDGELSETMNDSDDVEVTPADARRQEVATFEDPNRTPVTDPGIGPHLPRLTDIDEQAAHRATRQVATLFALVPLLAIGFVVIYFTVPQDATINFGPLHTNTQHLGLGLTLGLAVLLIGAGAVQWARQVMVNHETVEERHQTGSSPAERAQVLAELETGVEESAIGRRKILGWTLAGAVGTLGLPIATLFADLGPWPTKKLRAVTIEQTIWSQGVRLVNDVTYTPIKATDLVLGQLVNAEPENLQQLSGTERMQAEAKAAIIIVRMDPDSIKIPDSRRDWQVGGILCYSKICTHVGCPISLWEHQTHHLLCPCHQSTFDLGDAGVVVFGPAARSLPQLPITTDAAGYLIARSGFTVPVGPSYFERNSPEYYQRKEG